MQLNAGLVVRRKKRESLMKKKTVKKITVRRLGPKAATARTKKPEKIEKGCPLRRNVDCFSFDPLPTTADLLHMRAGGRGWDYKLYTLS
jgi:hypothetical protein